ncbi:membrane-spanning 4-domains subfamily A member 4A-like [Aplochiton taeniatus]
MSSSSTVSTSTYGGVVVITHILPAGGPIGEPFRTAAPGPPLSLGRAASSILGRFKKGEPKALGTVQIMVGVLAFLIGIVMAIHADTLGIFSGIFIWGATFYIIAGSLTVAAGRTLNKCLVNGSLGMNIVAAIVSLTGVILYSMDAAGVTFYCSFLSVFSQSQTQGVSGVLAIFSLLEFTVSISVSVFACKATCCSEPPEVFIVGNEFTHGNTGIPVASSPPFTTYETVSYPKAPEEHINQTAGPVNDQPPQYSPDSH